MVGLKDFFCGADHFLDGYVEFIADTLEQAVYYMEIDDQLITI